jgi:hypothetical protein
MTSDFKDPFVREYNVALVGFMALYAVMLFTVIGLHDAGRLEGWIAYPAALLPTLPIAGVMWAVMRYLNRCDEFMRAILTKRIVAAVCVALVACVAWGFLEVVADAPHPPLFWAFPVFWAMFGLVSPFIKNSR